MSKLIDSFPNWYTAGIFTRLGTLFPDELPWANIHGQELDLMYFGNHSGDKETSPLLDKFIEQNRGNDTPEVLSKEQITSLANILYTRYGVQWDKLYKVLSEEYNPIENYSLIEEETPNITRTETPNITRTETPNVERSKTTSAQSDFTVTTDSGAASDVYGFNSNSPVPQAETSGNSTVTTRGDSDKNVTTETETETGTRTETETGTRTETETGNRRLTRSGNIGVTTTQQMLESEIKLWEWNFYETVFKDVDTVLTVPKYNFYYRRFSHND